MIYLKNYKQIEKMRKAGHLLYEVLTKVKEAVKPGVTTAALDAYAEELIRRHHATPSFLHYEGYPATLCTSIDDEVVHGIPSDKVVLQEGSIISLDCGLMLDGWQSDSAVTVAVGEVSEEKRLLMHITEQCFFEGAMKAVDGNRIGDIGAAVQKLAEENGYGVIRSLTGHGIGRSVHEDPNVPNYGEAGRGLRLRGGMTIAVEPMIAMCDYRVHMLPDDWTWVTHDHQPCSHYEHTIAIGSDLPEILSLPDFDWAEYLQKRGGQV